VRQRALLFCSINLDIVFNTLKDCEDHLDKLLECSVNLIKGKSQQDKVLSLTAVDLMKSSVGEDTFGRRISTNFDMIISKIAEYTKTIKLPEFFDFMESFIQTHHCNITPSNLETLLKALVKRVVTEQDLVAGQKSGKAKKTLKLTTKEITISKTKPVNTKLCTHRISKCWCVIRYIAEH